MATNGITDVFSTVSVPKPEYEELVRDSERLDIISAILEENKYISTSDLRCILGRTKISEGGENNA